MSSDSAMQYAQDVATGLREQNEDNTPDIGEYLESVLDYQYTRDARGELVSVRLLVSFGGPTTWVTLDGTGALVECSWWSDTQRVYVDDVPLSGPILSFFEECLLVS